MSDIEVRLAAARADAAAKAEAYQELLKRYPDDYVWTIMLPDYAIEMRIAERAEAKAALDAAEAAVAALEASAAVPARDRSQSVSSTNEMLNSQPLTIIGVDLGSCLPTDTSALRVKRVTIDNNKKP